MENTKQIDQEFQKSSTDQEESPLIQIPIPAAEGDTIYDYMDHLSEVAFKNGIYSSDTEDADKDYKLFATYCQKVPNAMLLFDNDFAHIGSHKDFRKDEQKQATVLCLHLSTALSTESFDPKRITDKLNLIRRVSALFQRSVNVPSWWTNKEAKSKYRSVGCAIIVRAIDQIMNPSEDSDNTIKNPKITASTETFQQFLKTIGITIRYNQMTMKTEYEGIPDAYGLSKAPKNELSNLMQIKLTDEFRKYTNRKSLAKSEVANFIYFTATANNAYDPWCDYLNSLSWDGKDHMKVIYDALGVVDETQRSLIFKWLCQTVAIAYNWTRDHPIRSEGVLILTGEEGCRKSTFFETLLPNPDWYTSASSTVDTSNKDTFLTLLGSAITEISEIDRTFRANKSDIKNFIIADKDTFRKPYAPEATTEPRRTSFCGTTNENDFLNRDAGHRRWWVVKITKEKIDIDAIIAERDQMWAQAKSTVDKDINCFRLTEDEMNYLKKDAEAHVNRLSGEDDLLSSMDWNAATTEWQWLTPSEILNNPSYHVSQLKDTRKVGRALTQIMKEKPKIDKTRSSRGYKYFVPPPRGIPPQTSKNDTYANYAYRQQKVKNYQQQEKEKNKQVAIKTGNYKPDID